MSIGAIRTTTDIYFILTTESEDKTYRKNIAFSNADRIKNWIQDRLTNSQETVRNNPLSPRIKESCKDHSHAHTIISMSGASAICVFYLNTSYLLKTVAAVAAVASLFIYNKFTKITEDRKADYKETWAINQCLPYLTNANSIQRDLSSSRRLLQLEDSSDEEDPLDKKCLLREIENLEGLSFFTSKSELIKKCINVFIKNDLNSANKMAACRDFTSNTFYGAICLLVLKDVSLIEMIRASRRGNMLSILAVILAVMAVGAVALGVFCIVAAVKNALIIIAHRNDEAKKHIELGTITEEERSALLS